MNRWLGYSRGRARVFPATIRPGGLAEFTPNLVTAAMHAHIFRHDKKGVIVPVNYLVSIDEIHAFNR